MKYIGENAIKKLISLIKGDLATKQPTITASGLLKGDGAGTITAADTQEATLVDVPNGLLKGDGTTISAAVAEMDYMVPPAGGTTGQILKKTETGTEWADTQFKPAGKSYLTFSSPNSFTLKVKDATKHWDGTLEYFASNKTWTVWDGTTALSSVDNDGEYVLYLRGTGNTVITGNNLNYIWVLTGSNIACIGNIENLLDYATVESGAHPTMASSCYYGMFYGCTSLTQAPALPATTLAEMCYGHMFRDCTGLTQAPALPATTMKGHCYYYMFQGCTGLIQAPALPATTLETNCYFSMFYGCIALTQAPKLPATTLASNCYYGMFRNCTSLTQAPALPATTLANNCYQYMFYGCTSLKLSSSKTDEYTQEYRIPITGTGTTATNALTDMFASTGGTFTGTPEINTTYYLSSDNMVVYDTEVATLREYVGSVAAPSSHASQHATGGTDPITPASIGAAPAGYGSFGETLTDALVLDDEDGTLLRNKLIEIAQSMEAPNTKRIFFHAAPFVESYWNFGIVSSFVNETGKLRVVLDAYMTNGHAWKMMYSEGNATEWTEPEFQNPIMIVGREYRTPERYQNKAVYKKLDSDGVIWWSTDQSTWKREAERAGAAPSTHASQHATGGSDPISPESIGAAQRIIRSPNIADLLEWASAQTQSGAFYVDPSVVTANTPEPGVWFNGFIEVGIAGPGRITLSTNNHEAKTYVNCVSSGAWQGWAMQYSDTVRPKPKDIGAAPALKCVHVTLSAAGWHNFSQTAATPGVLEDETKQLITPTPALASQTAYYNAGIRCTSQSAGKLTFTAKTIPTADLTVYVTIQEVGA